jgi:hypothetical protein
MSAHQATNHVNHLQQLSCDQRTQQHGLPRPIRRCRRHGVHVALPHSNHLEALSRQAVVASLCLQSLATHSKESEASSHIHSSYTPLVALDPLRIADHDDDVIGASANASPQFPWATVLSPIYHIILQFLVLGRINDHQTPLVSLATPWKFSSGVATLLWHLLLRVAAAF